MKKFPMIKVSVPIIKSDRPLRTGIVKDEDVEAYLVLDREILNDRIGKVLGQAQKLVAVKHIPSFPFPLIVVDLENREFLRTKVCIIEEEGIRINKSYDTGRGLIVSPKIVSPK
jgi:hypothetical protein